MIIYVHKVISSCEDGWGRSNGFETQILGTFSTKEKAFEHKNKRDSNINIKYHDVGNSWIEEVKVK